MLLINWLRQCELNMQECHQQTLMIPPKERERQCLLMNGERESAEGVSTGCFSNCTQRCAMLRAVMKADCTDFFSLVLRMVTPRYLSDKFLLLGRFRHVVDLLVQLFEGRFGVTLSVRWLDGAGAAVLTCDCFHRGWRGGGSYRTHRAVFGPRAEGQVILEKMCDKTHITDLSCDISLKQVLSLRWKPGADTDSACKHVNNFYIWTASQIFFKWPFSHKQEQIPA